MRSLALVALLAAPVAAAEGLPLDPADRAAFGAEVRALLLDEPQIVARALTPAAPAAAQMAERIEEDLSVLDRLGPPVLAGHDIALITGPDCADCAAAATDLEAMSKQYGTTFTQRDISDPAAAQLAEAMGVEDLPVYVLPRMILQGHIPTVVLTRYLD